MGYYIGFSVERSPLSTISWPSFPTFFVLRPSLTFLLRVLPQQLFPTHRPCTCTRTVFLPRHLVDDTRNHTHDNPRDETSLPIYEYMLKQTFWSLTVLCAIMPYGPLTQVRVYMPEVHAIVPTAVPSYSGRSIELSIVVYSKSNSVCKTWRG